MEISLKNSLMSIVVSGLLISISGCSSGGDGDSVVNSGVSFVSDGVASVSGSTATAASGITASSAFKATADLSVDSTTSAVLVVDSNSNGEFGDSEDKVLTSNVSSDGGFDFGAVAVNATGETKAQLTVSKQGFAPVTKIITLSDGQSVSVETDAASTPLLTEVVDIATYRAAGTLSSSFLKIGLKRTDTGLSSYSQIVSLSDMKANADVPISGDVETETVIPLGSLPDSVTSVTAESQSFDPTNEEDAAKFPGEYTGVGEPGQGEQRLVSVGFDYMSLTDQNGDTIDLDLNQLAASSKLLPQAVDYTSCLRTSTRYLSGAQLDLFKKYGDDDNTTSEFEIPLWYYNSSVGNWQYLGQAEVYGEDGVTDYNTSSSDSYAYAKMCITENWGTSVNLDYSFAPQEPLNVCVVAQDQDENPISGLYVSAQKDTARDGHYLDQDGKTKIALLAGNTVSDYEFSYSGALTGWNKTIVQQGTEVVTGGADGCDNTINITVVNPYSATLKVTAKELDGTVAANKYVYVYNSSWGEDYYYEGDYTDVNGEATFNVKPTTNYGVYYSSSVVDVNINATVASPEQADNGRIATVVVQEEEVAPEVSVYMYNNSISNTSESVNFYVSASDGNDDAISLQSLTLNGTSLVAGTDYTVTDKYTYKGYEYFYAKLDLNAATVSAITPSSLSAGNYSLVATYSDSKAEGSDSQRFTVNENRAPRISSVYLKNDVTGYIYINSNIAADTYDINAYAYDPDGDEVTLSYRLDDVNLTSNISIDLADGDHTLVVNATDGTLEASQTFNFFIGNHTPEITSFGSTSYSIDLASQDTTVKLYAYAQDKDWDTLNVKTTDGTITLNPSYTGSNYFVSDSITIDANATFTIVANDGDKNSSVKSLTVTTYEANQAPVFTKELTPAQVAIGSSLEFECLATDPEGDAVSYAWSVDDVLQSNTSSTFTHTFTKTSVISCTASDADALEQASTTSSATITAYDAGATGNLVVKTLPGAIVATHDTTTLVPVETKVVGSDGQVTFVVAGTDRVTFSVSLAPDLAVNQDVAFKGTLADLSNMLDYACTTSDTSVTLPTACSSYDKTAFLNATSISNELANLVLSLDTSITVTAEDIDTDNSGAIDASESYAFELAQSDANGDGTLSWSELNGATSINSEFFINVPVREYDINLYAYDYQTDINQDYYQDEEWTYTPTTIDFSGFLADVRISFSNYYNYIVTSIDGNATSTGEMQGFDGVYSYTASYIDENNDTKYLLALDKTATDVASLSYTPSDFNLLGTALSITTSSLYENIYIDAVYNNHYIDYTSSGDINPVLINSSVLTYTIYGQIQSYDEATGINTYDSHNNYYGDGTLQTSYNGADYPYLNVELSFDPAGSISFAGSDLSKVNTTSISYSGYTSNGSVNVSFNYTVTPTTASMPDLNATLPAAIVSSISGDLLDSSLYVDLSEFKNMSETDFIDAVTTDESLLYTTGERYQSTSVSLNSGVTAMSNLRKDFKPNHAKPFSIGYEAKSAFTK